MKASSAKAKGRALCKLVKAKLHELCVSIDNDDIKVTSSGSNGEDLQFSKNARLHYPISIECKNHAKFAIYKDYAQAKANAACWEPVLVIKQNHSKPLAIVDLDYLLELIAVRNK